MSFGSHNLADDPGSLAPASASVAPSKCPITRWAPWLAWWRKKEDRRPSRLWAKMAVWGAKGVAAFYVLACVKCITIYIVVPAVTVWWMGGGGGGGEGAAEKNHGSATPVVGSAPVSDSVLPGSKAGGAAVSDAEDWNTEAAR